VLPAQQVDHYLFLTIIKIICKNFYYFRVSLIYIKANLDLVDARGSLNVPRQGYIRHKTDTSGLIRSSKMYNKLPKEIRELD
jgi:hypothetical protein